MNFCILSDIMEEQSITRNNHYVPQAIIKNWSKDGNKVWVHRNLVSHEKVPIWKKCSVEKILFQPDLYTSVDIESLSLLDEHEVYFKKYEDEGLPAIKKILHGRKMSKENWKSIALFIAIQDLRTPFAFIRDIACNDRINESFNKMMTETTNILSKSIFPQENFEFIDCRFSNQFNKSLKFRINKNPHNDMFDFEAEMIKGRELWLFNISKFMEKNSKYISSLKWSVILPANGWLWPLTDHPVTKMRLEPGKSFDNKGDWFLDKTNIFIPISPQIGLLSEVGSSLPSSLKLNVEYTKVFFRALLNQSRKWVVCDHQDTKVPMYKPRSLDKDGYDQEKREMKSWHPSNFNFASKKAKDTSHREAS